MGFSVALWLPFVLRRLGWGAVVLILGGGAAYVLGTIVFASRRPRLSPACSATTSCSMCS